MVAVQGAHRFLGELSLLIGQRLYLTGVVREAGEVIEVPLPRIWQLVSEDKAISDMILSAFMARRAILVGLGAGIKLIGLAVFARLSTAARVPGPQPDAVRVDRSRIRRWAEGLLCRLDVPPGDTPVVIASGGEILRNPSTPSWAQPSGWAGARCLRPLRRGRRRRRTGGHLGFALRRVGGSRRPGGGGGRAGGQAGTSSRIENYMGFPAGVSGNSSRNGEVPGGEVRRPPDDPGRRRWTLRSEPGHHGSSFGAPRPPAAHGRRRHRGPVPPSRRASPAEDFEGGGVYYAATQAEAQLCAGSSVVVVGGETPRARRRCSFPRPRVPAPDPRRRPGQVDVAISRRPGGAQPVDRGPRAHRGGRATGRHELEAMTVADNRTGERSRSPPRRCSSSSAPRPTPSGSTASWQRTRTVSC